jgi:hypothetical protein
LDGLTVLKMEESGFVPVVPGGEMARAESDIGRTTSRGAHLKDGWAARARIAVRARKPALDVRVHASLRRLLVC